MPAFDPSPDLPTLPEIARSLVDLPRIFADCQEIPGARVYTQSDHPECRQGNHAFILKSDDFTQVIVDAVTWIYQDLDITPRVWSAGPAREQAEVAHVLAQAGYRIIPASRKLRHFVRPEAANLPLPAGLDIRPVPSWDISLEEFFASDSQSACCLAQALKRNQSAASGTSNKLPPSGAPVAPFRLFGAWAGDRLVSLASLTLSRGLYWLDHVKTSIGEEGKGYCQALLSTLLNNPVISAPGRQVVASDNPAAIHIFQKLGFRPLEDANPFWEAILEGTHRSRDPEDLDDEEESSEAHAGPRSKNQPPRPARGQSRSGGQSRNNGPTRSRGHSGGQSPSYGPHRSGGQSPKNPDRSGPDSSGGQAGSRQPGTLRPGSGRGKSANPARRTRP